MMRAAESMTMTENANLIEILRAVGWTGDQISDFLLGVEGRVSVEETAQKIKRQTEGAASASER